MPYTLISSSKFPLATTGLTAQTTLSGRPTADATVVVLTIQSAGTTARLGGPPTFGGTAMTSVGLSWNPYSASGDESNLEMWYVVNPTNPRTADIVVPRTAGTFWTTTTWASCSLGSQSLYLTSSYGNSGAGGSATASYTMTTAPASGGIWYMSNVGDGAANAASAWSQLRLQNTDVGAWNWQVNAQSQSSAASIQFRYDYAAETWAVIIGAWGEEKSPEPPAGAPVQAYTMIFNDDDILQRV